MICNRCGGKHRQTSKLCAECLWIVRRERFFLALELRESGMSYKDVGMRIGEVSAERARQLCKKAERVRRGQLQEHDLPK